MRCLWITRQDPRPANSGELIYSLGLMTALASHNDIDVTVLSHGPEFPDDSAATKLVNWRLTYSVPRRTLYDLFTPLPSDASRLGNKELRSLVIHALTEEQWDCLIIDQAACGWVLDIDCPGFPPLVYISHNHEASMRPKIANSEETQLLSRLAMSSDARKYAALEDRLVQNAALVTCITPEDEEAFKTDKPDLNTVVLVPGHTSANDSIPNYDQLRDTPRRAILTGAFQWIAKRRNLELFLKATSKVFPNHDIKLSVVGKTDPDFFNDMKKNHPWADFHPNVDSITPFIKESRLGVLPDTLGGGFKLKALDYISHGIPLAAVESSLRGLPIDKNKQAISAPDHITLASEIAQKIDDLDFLIQSAQANFEACRFQFNWQESGRRFHEALANTLS